MIFSEEEQRIIANLPPVLRTALKCMVSAINNIINGECDETKLIDTMATLNNNSSRKYGDGDLISYDTACKIMRIPITNRNKLRKLCNRYDIKQVVLNNHKVGFLKSDIQSLKVKLNKRVNNEEENRT